MTVKVNLDADNNDGAVHDLSCCGCGKTTGWIAWREAHKQGWRKFRTNLNTYAICRTCRAEEKGNTHGSKKTI